MNWFMKTLFGYKVVCISKENEVWFTHRPFKPPLIQFKKHTKKINGLKHIGLFYDEVEELLNENL